MRHLFHFTLLSAALAQAPCAVTVDTTAIAA
jgi:hypothetical protein